MIFTESERKQQKTEAPVPESEQKLLNDAAKLVNMKLTEIPHEPKQEFPTSRANGPEYSRKPLVNAYNLLSK